MSKNTNKSPDLDKLEENLFIDPKLDKEARELRDKIYGKSSHANWEGCKNYWVTKENLVWLRKTAAGLCIIFSFIVSNSQTNITSAQINDLQLLILKEQRIIIEKYDGLPKFYGANSSETSSNVINQLEKYWREHDAAVSNLNYKKIQLTNLVYNYNLQKTNNVK